MSTTDKIAALKTGAPFTNDGQPVTTEEILSELAIGLQTVSTAVSVLTDRLAKFEAGATVPVKTVEPSAKPANLFAKENHGGRNSVNGRFV